MRRRFRRLPAILAFDRTEQQVFPCMLPFFNTARLMADTREQALQLLYPLCAQF